MRKRNRNENGGNKGGLRTGASGHGDFVGIPFLASVHDSKKPQKNCDWPQCREPPQMGSLLDDCRFSLNSLALLLILLGTCVSAGYS